MSLVDELRSIDLSSVLDARVNISGSLANEELQVLIDGEGISAALAGLGEAISAIQDAQGNPEALLMPMVEAVAGVAELFDTDSLDLGAYQNIVKQGAQIVTQLFALIGDGDPAKFSIPGGGELGEILNHASNFSQHFSAVGFGEAANVKNIIDNIEQGLPVDPNEFAEYAIGLIMPFSNANLLLIRDRISSMISGAAEISVDTNVNAGALASLERLRLAAELGDASTVNHELTQLKLIRNNTLNAIRGVLKQGTAKIQALDIQRHMTEIENIADSFQISSAGVIDFLDKLREQFIAMRQLMENAEFPELGPIIDDIASKAEELLRETVEKPIDRAVSDIKIWLRNQLAQLNLRYYRGLISKFFRDVETQIRAANFDAPADQARAFLESIESTINGLGLNDEIQNALGGISTTLNTTVSSLQTSLQQIVDGVNGAAASAQGILEQVADQLENFQQAVENIIHTVENLGIEQARDAVISAIADLKKVAETILGVAPLPDAMKPAVDDVIKQLDKIDVDEALAPVFDALNQLQIPPSVLDQVNEVLLEASTAIQNLVTEELIQQLDEEFSSAIAELNNFDPGNLLSGVTEYFEQAAGFIEQLDPRPVVEQIRGPFDAVLQAIDAVHPNRLLRPVIEAYEGVFSAIEMPNPSESLGQLSDTLNSASEQIGEQVSQPLQQLTGQQARPAGESAEPQSSAAVTDDLPEVRPGDIIRLLGYIPNKLREALQAMEASSAGQAMQVIDSLCNGLAQQIRQLQQLLWQAEREIFNGVEAVLKPLASAQMQAQLALQANFSLAIEEDNVSVDIQAAGSVLASLSTGAMRSDLEQELVSARQNIAAIIGHAGGSGGAFLERLISQLENSSLGRIGNDLDALLQALDPEPLAVELDGVARAAMNRLPEITGLLDAGAQQAIQRLIMLVQQFNPVSQGMKFLTVFDIVREELDLLNPRRLATELAQIHKAIRSIVSAYDPALLAAEISQLVEAVAAQIRQLDPGAMLGDLSQFDGLLANLEGLSPVTALQDIDGALDEVGERLTRIDLQQLLIAVNELPDRVEISVTQAGQAIIDNLKDLLASIEYFSANASVSVSIG